MGEEEESHEGKFKYVKGEDMEDSSNDTVDLDVDIKILKEETEIEEVKEGVWKVENGKIKSQFTIDKYFIYVNFQELRMRK